MNGAGPTAGVTPHARRMTIMDDHRLIGDYLPLDTFNAISARERKYPKYPVALVRYWLAQ